MKTKFIISSILLLLFIQCSTPKNKVISSVCNENIEFKNIFMLNVTNVENYTTGKGDRKKFDESLVFLSKYVHISYEETMNYANEYTNYSVFKKDKDNWLQWYEENKCKNIQFK
jgi:hypothetical protein